MACLNCPRDREPLELKSDRLVCSNGHSYPVVDTIPVFLLKELPGNEAINESLALAHTPTHDSFNGEGLHPQVEAMLYYTNGILYKNLKPTRYPIPKIRLEEGNGKTLLDVGCNWGRGTVSAAMRGYTAVGLDPHLVSLRAARHVSAQSKVACEFVCGDARQMPFEDSSFDYVFSYSVIQHFSKSEARTILQEIQRVLKPGGVSFIQMPNKYGIRCLYHLAKRGFSEGEKFDVRYYSPPELKRVFEQIIGPSELSVDGYFGLGVQPDDIDLLPLSYRAIVRTSETIRKMSLRFDPLVNVADSVYVKSVRKQ